MDGLQRLNTEDNANRIPHVIQMSIYYSATSRCHREALFGDMFCMSETAVMNANICTGTPGKIKEMRIWKKI